MSTTAGTLLGGKIAYAQPDAGYRTGLEPVLLAASIPALPGALVMEAGTGAGAGLLALAARVPDLRGTGVEIDPAMAALARENLAANAHATIRIETADIGQWRSEDIYDHAFANPPWHSDAGTASPMAGRQRAKQAADGLLARWSSAMAASLCRRGTLSLILPAACMAEGVQALDAAACGEIVLYPLWRRAGEGAKLIILRGTRFGRGGCSVAAGLVLHEADGRLTDAAEAVLRGGAALPL